MSAKQRIAILVTGDPVPSVALRAGSFADMIARAVGQAWPRGYEAVDVRVPEAAAALCSGELVPAAVIITGSPASVPSREPWIVQAEDLVRVLVARAVPLLGICFGHQLIAQALGGEVRPNPAGREIGTVTIERLDDDPFLQGLPLRFAAQVSHSDSVTRPPPGARVLARSSREAYQCLCFGPRCYGVQFHPEFDAAVMKGYLVERRASIAAEGQDPDALVGLVCDTPLATQVLARFVTHCIQAAL